MASKARLFATIISLFSVLLAPSNLRAQNPADTFDELRSRLPVGDTLRIRDAASREIKGKLAGISGSQLSLSVDGSQRTFAEPEVREVWHQQKDSLANGTVIGLAVGAASGLLAPGPFCGGFDDSECGTIVRVIFVPLGAGVGAVSGLLLDLAVKRSVLVFSRNNRPDARLDITPIVSPHHAGVRMSLRF